MSVEWTFEKKSTFGKDRAVRALCAREWTSAFDHDCTLSTVVKKWHKQFQDAFARLWLSSWSDKLTERRSRLWREREWIYFSLRIITQIALTSFVANTIFELQKQQPTSKASCVPTATSSHAHPTHPHESNTGPDRWIALHLGLPLRVPILLVHLFRWFIRPGRNTIFCSQSPLYQVTLGGYPKFSVLSNHDVHSRYPVEVSHCRKPIRTQDHVCGQSVAYVGLWLFDKRWKRIWQCSRLLSRSTYQLYPWNTVHSLQSNQWDGRCCHMELVGSLLGSSVSTVQQRSLLGVHRLWNGWILVFQNFRRSVVWRCNSYRQNRGGLESSRILAHQTSHGRFFVAVVWWRWCRWRGFCVTRLFVGVALFCWRVFVFPFSFLYFFPTTRCGANRCRVVARAAPPTERQRF